MKMKKLFVGVVCLWAATSFADSELEYITQPKAIYPQESRRAGEEGQVLIRVLVGTTGEVEAVGVHKSSGFMRLDDAALAAVAKAKYKPRVRDGVAVRSYQVAPVSFILQN